MTSAPWTYEPRSTYLQRQADAFGRQARTYAFQHIAGQQLEDNGVNPALYPTQPTYFDKALIRPDDLDRIISKGKAKKRGGALGAVGDALHAVGLDNIDQPWDVLRPLKRVMDAENRYVAKPIAKAGYETVTGNDYAHAPGIVKFGLEALASPSTYIGPESIAKLAGSTVAKRGAAAFAEHAIESGGPIEGRLARGALKLTGAPTPMLGGAPTDVINAVDDTHLRALLGGETPTPRPLSGVDKRLNSMREFLGIAPSDESGRPIMEARQELKQRGESLSNLVSTRAAPLVRDAFDLDEFGRIASLPGKPTIQDVAAQYPKYVAHLDDKQKGVLDTLREVSGRYERAVREHVDIGSRADIMNGLEDGLDNVTEGGFYLPRGQINPQEPSLRGTGGTRAKKSFEKGASWPSMMEAMDAGHTYEPFESAIKGYSRDASNRIIDVYTGKLLKGATGPEGDLLASTPNSRLEAAAPGLQSDVQGLRDKIRGTLDTVSRQQTRGRAEEGAQNRLQKLLNEAESKVQKRLDTMDAGSGLYTGTPKAGADLMRAEAELNILEREANSIAGATQSAADTARGTRGRLNDSLDKVDDLRNELDSKNAAYQKALSDTRPVPRDEGTIDLPGLQGVGFPEAVAGSAQKWLTAEAKRQQPGIVKTVNGLLRGLQATGDISFTGIQGLLGATRDPAGYLKSWWTAMDAGLHDPSAAAKFFEGFDAAATAASKPTSTDWVKAGLHIGGQDSEFAIRAQGAKATGIQALPSIVERRVPLVARSNRAFGAFGDAMRLQLAETLAKAHPDASLDQVAKLANLTTGWTKGRFMGDAGEFLNFAPRFFQSQLEMLTNAAKVNDPMGRESARILSQMVGMGTTATYAINRALGNPTELNPDKPDFMHMRVGGQSVSLFGPWDSLARGVAHLSHGDAEYLVRSKASPLVRDAWDSITGKNFIGENAYSVLHPTNLADGRLNSLLGNFLPISVQDAEQSITSGQMPDVTGTAINALGVKAHPLSKADVIDEAARDAYGKAWDELTPQEITSLATKYPDRISATMVKRAKGVKALTADYFGIEDKVWDRIQERPEFSQYDTLGDWVHSMRDELVKNGTPAGEAGRRVQRLPLYRQVQSTVNQLQRRYVAGHPMVQQVLEDWWGTAPPKAA